MRKPRRVAGLQGAGGVPAETEDSAGLVMPEGSKRYLARGQSWMLEDFGVGRAWSQGKKILYGVGRTGPRRGS